ncbi:NAD(P)/FAD-dependent oxidoreductase [Herbiconiux sp. YIM B11900]|uniref:NAD(P)/FAD-dependent oxidoreductase n=1 Tax=Herbiconiux sp. YIM B11900 TaxID=3404131 RepID=UPI003F875DFD
MNAELVVVGASVASSAFIERLRELGDTRSVVVIDADPDAPYDRPPVSKHFLRNGDLEDIAVDWSDFDVTLVHARATGVDTDRRSLVLDDQSAETMTVNYEQLVIATGALPARLAIEPEDTFVLRSAEDARHLRAHTDTGQSVIIIGAGAIGVELASSLAFRGSPVTLIDRATGPLERLLAGHLSEQTTAWLEAAGVRCIWEASLSAIRHDDQGWVVELADGVHVGADVLVSAVGARPAVTWMSDSGLLTDGQLIVDETGRVLAPGGTREDIFGIGDAITRRRDDGSLLRTESWAAAREHATQLAETLRHAESAPVGKPYFWTEVAGRMVQVVGTLTAGANLTLESSNPAREAALYRVDGYNGTHAWIGVNSQPRIAKLLREP